jgi:hypothetical protein
VFFPSGSFTKTVYLFLFLPIQAMSPTLLMSLHFIKIIIIDDECKLQSSSLGSFIQSPFTASLLSPNILLVALLSEALRLFIPVMGETNYHSHTKQAQPYFSMFLFVCLQINWKTSRSGPEFSSHCPQKYKNIQRNFILNKSHFHIEILRIDLTIAEGVTFRI